MAELEDQANNEFEVRIDFGGKVRPEDFIKGIEASLELIGQDEAEVTYNGNDLGYERFLVKNCYEDYFEHALVLTWKFIDYEI